MEAQAFAIGSRVRLKCSGRIGKVTGGKIIDIIDGVLKLHVESDTAEEWEGWYSLDEIEHLAREEE